MSSRQHQLDKNFTNSIVEVASFESQNLGLTDEEVGFYDGLETNDSAVKFLEDESLEGVNLPNRSALRSFESKNHWVGAGVRIHSRGMFLKIIYGSFVSMVLVGSTTGVLGGSWDGVRTRIDRDFAADRPLVVHVIVALCDNKYQGIVPVPRALGDGQNPDTNLYWGAGGGMKSFFKNKAGWRPVACQWKTVGHVLDSVVYYQRIAQGPIGRDVYVVAEGWDGQYIREAINRFFSLSSGNDIERINIINPIQKTTLLAGGAAHVVAYVGHNGLMEAPFERTIEGNSKDLSRASIVLACASEAYFNELLLEAGSFPLLVTTQLMAPEAYTLDAAIKAIASGKSENRIREEAAQAYNKYQKCGLGFARRMFNVRLN